MKTTETNFPPTFVEHRPPYEETVLGLLKCAYRYIVSVDVVPLTTLQDNPSVVERVYVAVSVQWLVLRFLSFIPGVAELLAANPDLLLDKVEDTY